MALDARPVVVISGAPELKAVPQHFWRKLAAFMRDGRTGTVSFNIGRGKPSSLEARERVEAADEEST